MSRHLLNRAGRFAVTLWAGVLLCAGSHPFGNCHAANNNANYDESKVGTYTLPNPLVTLEGKAVKDAETWFKVRRPEILKLYQDHIYGHSPARPASMKFEVFDVDKQALDGTAVRKQVKVLFFGTNGGPAMNILMYLPREAREKVPVFLCLHFYGNQRVIADSGIRLGEEWDRKTMSKQIAPESTRGDSTNWKIKETLARGYGIATIYYCDIEPDFAQGIRFGLRSAYLKNGDTNQAPDAWGAIGAWAWGLSRGLDYLETDPDVDAKRVAVMGHSRLGKTALWAGASDPRFAMVIASCSGEMGASLARRNFGETVDDMIKNLSYQFCDNFKSYKGRWSEMPVDTHMLISLIAPRPVYLSTGSEDLWGDPKGEFLGAVAAGPVFKLLGAEGLGTDTMPPLDTPIMHTVGYGCHTGKHDVLPADWDRFLDFADLHFKGKKTSRIANQKEN